MSGSSPPIIKKCLAHLIWSIQWDQKEHYRIEEIFCLVYYRLFWLFWIHQRAPTIICVQVNIVGQLSIYLLVLNIIWLSCSMNYFFCVLWELPFHVKWECRVCREFQMNAHHFQVIGELQQRVRVCNLYLPTHLTLPSVEVCSWWCDEQSLSLHALESLTYK